ncbi:acyl-CoA dehydrogenase family protein [Actinomycetospora sp. NBC_00405]|uniref:acyl-CoA dehydrogenase family protein n=1 Tax=Actinomycetospora sp. NBC_00405 TaxID=2975952 RepID=UPI002E1ABCDF
MAAYELALSYAQQREQFGRPIAGFQLMQELLVQMLGNVTASLGMAVRNAQLLDAGRGSDAHSALTKEYCRRAADLGHGLRWHANEADQRELERAVQVAGVDQLPVAPPRTRAPTPSCSPTTSPETWTRSRSWCTATSGSC